MVEVGVRVLPQLGVTVVPSVVKAMGRETREVEEE